MAEELRAEQDHSMHVQKMYKTLEITIKETQSRLEESEMNALKGGKAMITKLEHKVCHGVSWPLFFSFFTSKLLLS